jgi:hypothetical protein
MWISSAWAWNWHSRYHELRVLQEEEEIECLWQFTPPVRDLSLYRAVCYCSEQLDVLLQLSDRTEDTHVSKFPLNLWQLTQIVGQSQNPPHCRRKHTNWRLIKRAQHNDLLPPFQNESKHHKESTLNYALGNTLKRRISGGKAVFAPNNCGSSRPASRAWNEVSKKRRTSSFS